MLPGVPTAISPAEARLLQRLARDRRVVEAGALLGFSTITMAKVATDVVSIDQHTGYSGDTWRRYRSNLSRFGVNGRVIPIRSKVENYWHFCTSDFAFIDLTGEAYLTEWAIRYAPAPLIAVHDFERQSCDGVARAVEHVRRSGYMPVERVDTLLVLRRP